MSTILEHGQIKVSLTPGHKDKRYFPRWEVKKRVEYSEGGWIAIRSYTKDLSLDGASIFVFGNPPERRFVQLKIHLADEDVFEARGRVAWAETEPTHKLFGIVFERLSKKAQKSIMRHAFELKADRSLFNSRFNKA